VILLYLLWDWFVLVLVIAATFLSINELKDVNEPQLETMNMAEGTKKHLRLISTAIFIIIGFVSVGLFCFYFIFA